MPYFVATYAIFLTNLVDLFSNIYGFSTGIGGLAYIGLGLGFFLATIVGASIADEIYQKASCSNAQIASPFLRLSCLAAFAT